MTADDHSAPVPGAGAMQSQSMIVLYASQTGNAESIAKHIHEEALARGHASSCHVADEYAAVPWGGDPRDAVLVVVTSTTGDGDHPDNSIKFWKWLRRGKPPGPSPESFFKGRPYTLLGLGDTNYTNFCQPAKRLDRRLVELGAVAVQAKALADDATGLEAAVDPWIARLWETLATHVVRDEAVAKAFAEASMRAAEKDAAVKKPLLSKDASKSKSSSDPVVDSSEATKTTDASSITPSTKETKDISNSTKETKTTNGSQNTEELASLVAKISIADAHRDGSSLYAPRPLAPFIATESQPPPAASPQPPPPPSFVVVRPSGVTVQPRPLMDLLPGSLPHELARDASDESIKSVDKISSTNATSQTPIATPTTSFSANAPFSARMTSVRCLTGPRALERVLEIELDIAGAGWPYHPGDAFGIIAPNPPELVTPLLERLNFPANEIVELSPRDAGCATSMPFTTRTSPTYFEIFTYFIELHAMPRKSFFRMLASHTSDDAEREQLMLLANPRDRSGCYARARALRPTLLDILASFPSCMPPLSAIIEGLGRLQPRYYSVACAQSPNAPGRVRFAFNVVEYQAPAPVNRLVRGLCSSWLDNITGNTTSQRPIDMTVGEYESSPVFVPFFPRASNHFHLPRDLAPTKTPLILIAAGTGITPFIGFLEKLFNSDRAHSQANRPVWLIYGHRFNNDLDTTSSSASTDATTESHGDALYSDRIAEFIASGVITKYIECQSREPGTWTGPKYVQHAIESHNETIWDLFDVSNASIFVCGSLSVGKSVNEAFANMVVRHRYDIQSVASAVTFLNDKTHEKRYLRDLWG